MKPTEIRIEDLENVCKYLAHKLKGRNYVDELKEILICLVKEGKKKSKIRRVTSSLLTELINGGYHPNHIYFENNNFFFNPKQRKIESLNDITTFLEKFNFEPNEYTVVFKGGVIFRSFKESLNSYNIVVTKTYNCFSTMKEDLGFKDSRQADESFIICSKVKALDHISARERREQLIGSVTNIFTFFHHKEKPSIQSTAVISRKSDHFVMVLDKPTKSILKTKGDHLPKYAAEKIKEIINNLELDGNSIYRFARSLDLHSAASAASATENQLLDLWAACRNINAKIIRIRKRQDSSDIGTPYSISSDELCVQSD